MAHQHSSSSSSSSSAGMAMTFFTSTQTPLYSESWTPRSTAGYAGTCIFLIALAVVFRGIMAFKHHMEHRWLDQHLNRRYVVVAGRKNEKARTSEDGNAQTALLVSATGVEEDVRVVRRHVRGPFPWRLSIDVPRAALAVVMSGVGYLLMLAVMTFNVGYFLSVLAGVFVGELLVGRYVQTEEH
ncbi:MAG: hypothetical protein M1815_000261 [Lichina confinis]|nr:MAG: hypothetical protein M1815_000261 [Lichina confinis]